MNLPDGWSIVITGTTPCYEHYHGDILYTPGPQWQPKLMTTWCYDKRQRKYICKIVSEKAGRGYKFFYDVSPEGLVRQINNYLD